MGNAGKCGTASDSFNNFELLVVLFILLIIIGCGCSGKWYGGYGF